MTIDEHDAAVATCGNETDGQNMERKDAHTGKARGLTGFPGCRTNRQKETSS